MVGQTGLCWLDVGERNRDERSAERSSRLDSLFSRLRRPNSLLERTSLRPATLSRTPLDPRF